MSLTRPTTAPLPPGGSPNSSGGKAPEAPTTDRGRRKGSPDHRPGSTASGSEWCAKTIGGCRRCAEYPGRRCPACVQRRRRAMQLIEEGRSIEQVATAMRLTVPRAERYVEEEEQARDLSHHHCDQVPAARIRKLYDQRRDEDPTLSIARIARAAKLDRAAVSAALTAAAVTPDDDHTNRAPEGPENHTLVGVEVAVRLCEPAWLLEPAAVTATTRGLRATDRRTGLVQRSACFVGVMGRAYALVRATSSGDSLIKSASAFSAVDSHAQDGRNQKRESHRRRFGDGPCQMFGGEMQFPPPSNDSPLGHAAGARRRAELRSDPAARSICAVRAVVLGSSDEDPASRPGCS
jgi:hypothetical protein